MERALREQSEVRTFTGAKEIKHIVQGEETYNCIVGLKVNGYLSKMSITPSGGGRQRGGAHVEMESEQVGKAGVTSLRESLEEKGKETGEKLVFAGH